MADRFGLHDSKLQLPSSLLSLFEWTEVLDYPPKIQLLRQGEVARTVYVITSGLVKLSRIESTGKQVIVGLRFAGAFLGETTAILGGLSTATATTITRSSLVRIPSRDFIDILNTRRELSWYLHERHAREIDKQLEHTVELISQPAQVRLARLLCDLTTLFQSDRDFSRAVRIPLKQYEIAELLAVTPEHACRVLRDFEKVGYIRRDRKGLIIDNPDLLRPLVNGPLSTRRKAIRKLTNDGSIHCAPTAVRRC